MEHADHGRLGGRRGARDTEQGEACHGDDRETVEPVGHDGVPSWSCGVNRDERPVNLAGLV